MYHLLKYGVTPEKTNNIRIPNIDSIFYPYFFAGLFDGDGHVGKRENCC